ncbi:type VI secretion system contractile sheath large subunit [Alphaproteobacteria bacterium KMM 3653]|uniref:Type VI secretion system contractile sheath large subunit n=1 Tax=Harenicola maris TaxID=2841044 RepID=A0AAP2G7W0_9RHOB|nr:type VI secretion system contractile sheath large subunit [Harenicola maris]
MATEAQTESQAGGEVTELDDFSNLLKQNFKPRSDTAATEVENAVSTLVKTALQDSNVIKEDILDTVDEMIAALDAKLTTQTNEIIHSKEYQDLESAWRGLHYCVMNSEPDAQMKIKVLNVSKKELERELRSYPGAKWDQSPLFKQIYEAEFGQLGGTPFGALIGDFYFDHSPADIRLLRDLGKIAAAAHAPFISAADAGLLNMDSWNELPNPADLMSIFETPDYAAWKSLRESENSRYVALTAPRMLGREPYGQDSLAVEAFNFEEETDGHEGTMYSWINSSYAMAANIARAHKEHGWTVQIRGVNSGGEVINLPTHTFATDDGSIDQKCPTEVAISDRREGELSKAGIISLVHRKNSDKAAFIGAQSLYKPKSYQDADATAADNLSSRIPYIFAVSRFSHYLKCMVRDQIGSTKEKEELTRYLKNWIAQYIDADPANSSEAAKAKRPLAGADVQIVEDEENPGYYMGKFFLRPHFQLEGMDIGMSLVSRLPGG